MAIKQEPDNLGFQGTLGIAHYRAGNWQEAVVVLEPVVRLSKGRALFKRFFLAMAHWQLGDKAEARKSFDRAVKIVVDQKVKYNRKLHIVGGEARELLGIPAAPP